MTLENLLISVRSPARGIYIKTILCIYTHDKGMNANKYTLYKYTCRYQLFSGIYDFPHFSRDVYTRNPSESLNTVFPITFLNLPILEIFFECKISQEKIGTRGSNMIGVSWRKIYLVSLFSVAIATVGNVGCLVLSILTTR